MDTTVIDASQGRLNGRTAAARLREAASPVRLGRWLLVLVALLPLGRLAAQEPAPVPAPTAATKPGPNDRQITLAVKSYIEREHFTHHPIDDEIARRWFGIFLEALDP